MQKLKIALVQTDIYWKAIEANLAMLEEKLWQITEPVDLIILPEMFQTGFTMDVDEVSEPMNLTTFKWMKQMAAQKKAVVTGSYIVREKSGVYNRLVWMQPDGNYQIYDKRHLFRMASEDQHFSMGMDRMIVELKGWKICPMICYDLRFPVWTRNRHQEYDLLLFVANWPASRAHIWDTLLQARSIENLAYTIGVNRVGKDGKEIDYSGHSGAYSPKGETLAFSEAEETMIIDLSLEDLLAFRERFPAHLDADAFEIK